LVADYGPQPDATVDANVDSKVGDKDLLRDDLPRDQKATDTDATTCGEDQCEDNGNCYDVGKSLDGTDPCQLCVLPYPNEPPSTENNKPSFKEGCPHDGECYAPDATRPGLECEKCSNMADGLDWVQDKTTCLIEEKCYSENETPAGTDLDCLYCAPNEAMDAWSVKQDRCFIDNACHHTGNPNPADPTGCTVCEGNEKTTRKAWSAPNESCDIESQGITYCIAVEKNADVAGLKCRQCKNNNGVVAFETRNDYCFVENKCYGPDSPDESGCKLCKPGTSADILQPIETLGLLFCRADGKCWGVNANPPPSHSCATCVAISSDAAEWQPDSTSNECFIDGVCYKAGDIPTVIAGVTLSTCGTCKPTGSPSEWTLATSRTDNTVCIIDGVCYAENMRVNETGDVDLYGCRSCDADIPFAWSPIPEGGCKVDGRCLAEQEYFVDSAGDDCAQCDKGAGDELQIGSAQCLIDDVCYSEGTLGSGSAFCATCDTSSSTTQWTPGPGHCFIDEECKPHGIKAAGSAANCLSCDSQHERYGWTIAPTFCFIDDECRTASQEDPSGCRHCSPDTVGGSIYWQWNNQNQLLFEDFEDSLDGGWNAKANSPDVGWDSTERRAFRGTSSFYYGNDATWSYFTSDGATAKANSGTLTTPPIAIPIATAGAPKQNAILVFSAYLDVEAESSRDILIVKVHSQKTGLADVVWRKNGLDPSTGIAIPEWEVEMKGWQTFTVSLDDYLGDTINVIFDFNTITAENNTGEGVYLDNVGILGGCTPATPAPPGPLPVP